MKTFILFLLLFSFYGCAKQETLPPESLNYVGKFISLSIENSSWNVPDLSIITTDIGQAAVLRNAHPTFIAIGDSLFLVKKGSKGNPRTYSYIRKREK